MNETVEMNSKSAYYDSDRILSKWGFSDNHCHNCGVLNSDLNGLLMQCAKCKRAYYCGMKCFNEHLPEHNKYCNTKEIYSQPKGNGIELKMKSRPILEPDEGLKKGLDAKKNKAKLDVESSSEPEASEATPTAVDNPVDKSESSEEVSIEDLCVEDHGDGNDSMVQEESFNASLLMDEAEREEGSVHKEEDEEVEELANDFYQTIQMHNTFSEFGRGQRRHIPLREEHLREEVDLRHADLLKREYSWMTPEWIDAQLRKTPRGRKLLESGELSNPVTQIRMLVEKGYITWEKPAWTHAKLRKTPRSKALVDSSGSLADDLDRDTQIQHTFSVFSQSDSSLRHMETLKSEYSWMTPEWIHAELRKTARGRKLLESGDLSVPVTDVKTLIEQGLITWEKPEWTKMKLRKTARGEAIKHEALQLSQTLDDEN